MNTRTHSQLVREEVFFFAGFDNYMRESVTSLLDHNTYKLVDGTLYDYTYSGEPDCPMDITTARFNNGFYIGAGCMGNGTVYWNKRKQENGDYKIFGQIIQNGELIIRTEEKVLIDFLTQTHEFKMGATA
jgi:hypothetical protein